ncbi:hypothetical protein GGI19_000819 [Coemansia pectinata]|uniref:SAP domain-containing protein n=1 Tax=Coemansia pectinata TaxID=1052879 RepID=A0A9W8H611_9FUNG|nr:hypothetical protein GGI19_000819 [Coemansia pectinata]
MLRATVTYCRRAGVGTGAYAAGVARYSANTKSTAPPSDSPQTKKPRERIKYMAIKPTSPALTRMAAKIKESEVAMDIAKEVDSFKFTTEDLIRALPMHRAQLLGGVDMTVSSADLMLSSKDDMVGMLYDLRTKRVESIVRAFNGAQLKQYLRQHQLKEGGTKKEMVNRILNDVWGISLKALEARFAMPKEDADQDGLTLPLSDDTMALLRTLEDGSLRQLEEEFGVKIMVDSQKREARVTGVMHHVRGALSTLRERLTANTTVQVELAKYGVPRVLSEKHTGRIAGVINRATGGALSNKNGEYFVRGDSPFAALDAQRALVGAMVEPKNQALFVVASEGISDLAACTVAPAANPFSQPPTFVPDMAFHTSPGVDTPTPISLLARHVLLERMADGSISRCSGGGLVQTLQGWAAKQRCLVGQSVYLSAKLGTVMVDMDSTHKRLATQFYTPDDLMTAIAQRAPLFGFSSNTSPLKWLREPAARESTTKQVVLRFCRLDLPLSSKQPQANNSAKSSYILPVSSADNTLVARVDVKAGKVDFGSAQVDHICDTRTANVVILQPAQDLQVCISSRQSVNVTADLSKALENVVRKLGISGHTNQHTVPHRHEVVETHLGRFGLETAEVVDVSHVQSSSGTAVRVHQTWDVIDDLRFSQVELMPAAEGRVSPAFMTSEEEWEKYLLFLFKAALEQPSSGLSTTDGTSGAR